MIAGLAHLTWARSEFLAQVPGWVPLDADLVVVLSGVVEIALGGALVLLARYREVLGWVTAAFFVAVFPGNISQFVDGDAAFGLDSDAARAVRLLFQPVLIVLALWSTGAWERVAGQVSSLTTSPLGPVPRGRTITAGRAGGSPQPSSAGDTLAKASTRSWARWSAAAVRGPLAT